MSGVRSTSIKAYHEIIEEGILGDQEVMVLMCINEVGEATDKEISVMLGLNINAVTGRRNELVKLGIVESCGRRECSVTGRRVYSWTVSDPIVLYPREPRGVVCPMCQGKGKLARIPRTLIDWGVS